MKLFFLLYAEHWYFIAILLYAEHWYCICAFIDVEIDIFVCTAICFKCHGPT